MEITDKYAYLQGVLDFHKKIFIENHPSINDFDDMKTACENYIFELVEWELSDKSFAEKPLLKINI